MTVARVVADFNNINIGRFVVHSSTSKFLEKDEPNHRTVEEEILISAVGRKKTKTKISMS